MTGFKKDVSRKLDWLIAAILGAVSAVLYFASLANYAYPGISARLMAVWRGLDTATTVEFPVMGFFAKFLGAGNLIAPICGVISVMALYMLITFFLQERIRGEKMLPEAGMLSRVAGVTAAVVFMLTPAVRSAATHAEPRMFDAAWALLMFMLFIPMARGPYWLMYVLTLVLGVAWGVGLCDSALMIAFSPFYLVALVMLALKRGSKPYLPLFLTGAAAFIAFLVTVNCFEMDLGDLLKGLAKEFKNYYKVPGWLFVAIFSTLPFVTSVFSSNKAFNENAGVIQWLFHVSMTVAAILSVATPLSPSSQLETYGILPVVTSAFAAAVAGYVVAYWWHYRRTWIGRVSGGIFAFVALVTCVWNLFAFDGNAGAFADRVAKKIIDDLGNRKWFISDGTLDDHLKLAAADAKKELYVISMSRDLEEDYLEGLGKLVREKRLGGDKSEELELSLHLGVLPFVQDWFAVDPSIVKEAVIFGAPDLWYSGGYKPVPEFFFFGADETIEIPLANWLSAWKEFDSLLETPKGWGSYREQSKDPVVRLRHSLRRHLGLIANDRGVWLQDKKREDEAFAMYELVLHEIDVDNVCALFNEVEMAGKKYPKALAKKSELERQMKAIVDNKQRRYQLWWLGRYYGYIRNPDLFVRLGHTWARSGRPGDALAQLRRAIDFVQSDKKSVLLNMMAALYANDEQRVKSRAIYQDLLVKNSEDHEALIGMMRLELLDGNSQKALEYLEKAAKSSPANTRTAKLEIAMLAMMKGDLKKSRDLFGKLTDEDPKDMQAWSLLAAVTMQLYDAEKDKQKRAAYQKYLESVVLPSMEKQSHGPYDYYVQATKAFLLMRQGSDRRREARDAFVAAARARPSVAVTQDIVLGLDISLDDKEHAERQAREVLRRNRKAPLANYVMGSLSMGRGQDREAEAYLRRAADASKPVSLAQNDLAELLRRNKNYVEAERYARAAVKSQPKLYIAWETLASILLDSKRSLDEAEECAKKACELSKSKEGKESDIRMLITLARVQLAKGDGNHARTNFRKIDKRIDELSEYEKKEYQELRKRVK